ncbi:MAG: hypothetical protein ABFD54_04015 [Armatimonadota bacterium]|nr:hypothetical protein [bacterium]
MASRVVFLVMLLASITCPAMACYSGLLIIPTAETVDTNYLSVEYQNDGIVSGFTPDTHLINTELGLTSRFETGIDFDVSKDADQLALFNAKYLFSVDTRRDITLAAGTFNLTPNIKSTQYLVGMKDFHSFRLHLGGMHIVGSNEWFTGIDSPINERIMLMADYTSGSDNYSSAGFNYQFNDRFGVLAGSLFPNSGGDCLYTIHLVYCAPFRHVAHND